MAIESGGDFTIRDVYKIDKDSNAVLATEYGKWEQGNGITIFERNMWKRRSDFRGHKIRSL